MGNDRPLAGLDFEARRGRRFVRPETVSGHWFGAPDRPLLGWLSRPSGGPAGSGVLILAPIGYEYWSSHHSLRILAQRLAAAGHLVLRMDYEGTGDSAGDQWKPDRLAVWRDSARRGADELRAFGAERLTVLGVRLGATIALLDGHELGADLVAAWAPVTSGRRHARELKLLSIAVPEQECAADADPTMVSAGTVCTPQTLGDIATLSVAKVTSAPAPRVLIVDDPKVDHADVVAALRALGCEVDQRGVRGGESALETPSEYATVPEEVLDALCDGIGRADSPARWRADSPAPGSAHPPCLRAPIASDGATLYEEIVTLGPRRLFGVLTTPFEDDHERPVVVFLNSGSEPHVGPGRAWVEYARALAARGYPCLRVDFSGWGESPDEGHAPGRPYDAHCIAETQEIVDALRALGRERVVLVGLCAGAWVALRSVLSQPVAGVIALNPQLYWRPGDPVEATMAETRERRTPERRRERSGCRWGWWDTLDLVGHRSREARWLDELDASRVPILLLFAAGDDGIEYLRNRLARRLGRLRSGGGTIRVAEVPEIDHSMHRAWLRASIVGAITEHLQRLGFPPAPSRFRRGVGLPSLGDHSTAAGSGITVGSPVTVAPSTF